MSLSVVEKAAIETFVKQGMSHNEIAITLKVSDDEVKEYVENELELTPETETEEDEGPKALGVEKIRKEIDPAIWEETLNMLIRGGVNDKDKAEHLMNKACNQLLIVPEDAQTFYGVALRQRHDSRIAINHKAAGGREGVTVYTKTASEMADEHLKTVPKQISRTARGNIYDIRKGEILTTKKDQ